MAPRIRLTAEWVAAAMGGTIVTGGTADEFSGVSIDTRTLKAGELYFGIRGDRFDGADFASAATEAGAAGVVVPRGRAIHDVASAVVIEVEDTTSALQA